MLNEDVSDRESQSVTLAEPFVGVRGGIALLGRPTNKDNLFVAAVTPNQVKALLVVDTPIL